MVHFYKTWCLWMSLLLTCLLESQKKKKNVQLFHLFWCPWLTALPSHCTILVLLQTSIETQIWKIPVQAWCVFNTFQAHCGRVARNGALEYCVISLPAASMTTFCCLYTQWASLQQAPPCSMQLMEVMYNVALKWHMLSISEGKVHVTASALSAVQWWQWPALQKPDWVYVNLEGHALYGRSFFAQRVQQPTERCHV